MEARDWAIVAATFLGPVFAVQAQKWIERSRERRQRKMFIFATLMTTRAARVSADHVRALNMIDTVFDGGAIFGVRHVPRKEKAVLDAWHAYLDHLNTPAANMGEQVWGTTSDNLFVELLFVMSKAVGYAFDRVHLRRIIYLPVAHGELEADQTAIRKGAARLLSGDTSLKMEVTGFPQNPAVAAAQLDLLKKFATALEGGTLSVDVQSGEATAEPGGEGSVAHGHPSSHSA